MKINILPYNWMNNLIRVVVVELAWYFLEEVGLIIAGVGLILEYALHQREKHLKQKEARECSLRLKAHSVVEAEKFHVKDRGHP